MAQIENILYKPLYGKEKLKDYQFKMEGEVQKQGKEEKESKEQDKK